MFLFYSMWFFWGQANRNKKQNINDATKKCLAQKDETRERNSSEKYDEHNSVWSLTAL